MKLLSSIKNPLSALSFSSSAKVTVSVSGNYLRILSINGSTWKWNMVPFNPAFLRGEVIADPNGLGQVIKQITTRMGVKQAKVVAAFPGTRAIPRIVPVPNGKDVYPPDYIPQQSRRIFGAVADNSYLYWNLLRKEQANQFFYVMAVPKDIVDSFSETLKVAGFKTFAVEVSGLAMARASQVGTGIVVNVDTSIIETVIVVNNIPMTMYTEALAEPTNEGVISAITGQMERQIPSYNERNADRPLLPDSPVLISGALPLDDETVKALGDSLARPVITTTSPSKFKYPDDFQPLTYHINLGLAMKAV